LVNLFIGIGKNGMGFLPLICKGCGKKLGILELIFNNATADIQVECKDCGIITSAKDVWFERTGRVKRNAI